MERLPQNNEELGQWTTMSIVPVEQNLHTYDGQRRFAKISQLFDKWFDMGGLGNRLADRIMCCDR
jgi:hypothetical protein